MGLLDLPYSDTPEMIDDPAQPEADVARSMGDLVTINRLFGGVASVVGPLGRLVSDVPPGATVRIVDVGAGSADVPNAVVRYLRERRVEPVVVAVDINPRMLRMAAAGKDEAVSLVLADALALPFPAGSFDAAVCSLTLHHLGLDASAALLRALDRATTRGFVVTDLVRDRLTHVMVLAGLRLIRAQPMTLHDADASVRRAFTVRDAERMVALSGVRGARIDSTWHYRLRIVQDKAALRLPANRVP